jgi:serine phosphatase RsbU (regulator of sigma subunit)
MDEDLNSLTLHTLHWIELFLRSHQPEEFNAFAGDEGGWRQFRNYLLLKTAKLLLWDVGGFGYPGHSSSPPQDPNAASALGSQTRYEFLRYCRPLKRVPGDMIEFLWINDRSFWVLVADGTGHSWLPHLLAQGLSVFWKSVVASPDMTPGKLFVLLHEQLQTCLPDGFFFEAALARFDSASVTVALAGDICILVRQQGDRVARPRDLGERCGGWLGLAGADRQVGDQETWPFSPGDELTMASDGLFNQPFGEQRLRHTILGDLAAVAQGRSLHHDVLQILENALASNSPDDDISVATVRRL